MADGPGDEDRRALAWLFLGRVGESSKARVAAYRQAVALAPHLQAAQIGLAHALEESAGEDEARKILGPYFFESSRAWVRRDPWNEYPFGPPGLGAEPFALLLETLCPR